MLYRFSMVLLILVVSACTSVPESIQVADNVPLVSYEEVVANPTPHQRNLVRWGGIIAKVDNQTDKTVVELVSYPLRSYGRPIVSDDSPGRFRVNVNGFLDPMVYKKGRAITFTGEILGLKAGKVGEHDYMFPTLQASGYHLWKEMRDVDVSTVHMWGDPFGYRYGFYPFFPYHHRVIIRRTHNAGSNTATPMSGSKQRQGEPQKKQL